MPSEQQKPLRTHAALAAHFSDHHSRFLTRMDDRLTYRQWEEQERPHEWLPVEDARGYTAWEDVSWRRIALTHGEQLVGVGESVIAGCAYHAHVAVLAQYHGGRGYLFFSDK